MATTSVSDLLSHKLNLDFSQNPKNISTSVFTFIKSFGFEIPSDIMFEPIINLRIRSHVGFVFR